MTDARARRFLERLEHRRRVLDFRFYLSKLSFSPSENGLFEERAHNEFRRRASDIWTSDQWHLYECIEEEQASGKAYTRRQLRRVRVLIHLCILLVRLVRR